MKLTHGFLLVAFGQLLRLIAGMVVFVVIARFLEPVNFGRFAYWLAIATIVIVPVNFGFGSMLLRSFGASPDDSEQSMSDVLTAKLAITGAIVFFTIIGSQWIPDADRTIFFLLFFSQIFESFSEYYNLNFRVNSDYGSEAKTASVVSVIHIVLMISSTIVFSEITVVALTFLTSRFIGLCITARESFISFKKIYPSSYKTVPKTLRTGWAYALEMGVLTTYMQIDSILINMVLGPKAVGIYQAGMKLVQGAFRIAPMLAQIMLPTLARAEMTKSKTSRFRLKAMIPFIGIGLVSFVTMTFFATPIVNLLFGRQYTELVAIMPLFGLLLFGRFLETGLGLILVSNNHQNTKVWAVTLQVLLVSSIGWMALKSNGLIGWQIVSCLGVFSILPVYFYILNINTNNLKSE